MIVYTEPSSEEIFQLKLLMTDYPTVTSSYNEEGKFVLIDKDEHGVINGFVLCAPTWPLLQSVQSTTLYLELYCNLSDRPLMSKLLLSAEVYAREKRYTRLVFLCTESELHAFDSYGFSSRLKAPLLYEMLKIIDHL